SSGTMSGPIGCFEGTNFKLASETADGNKRRQNDCVDGMLHAFSLNGNFSIPEKEDQQENCCRNGIGLLRKLQSRNIGLNDDTDSILPAFWQMSRLCRLRANPLKKKTLSAEPWVAGVK